MSKDIDEIRRKLRTVFGSENDNVFSGIVTEVNEEEFTCTVQRDEQVDYFDVRLRALVNSELQGLAFIPKVESTVLVCRIGNSSELFVCQFGEVDKIVYTNNDLTFNLNTEKVEVKKGDNISINIDSDKIEVINDQATIKITSGGFTISKGNSGVKKTLENLLTAIKALTVTTGVGPSGTPINIADFAAIEQDLTNYLEG